MGRAPCCDKSGLKKGPWTPEEDNKLLSFIQIHGPGNWRSLPKNAGLERCGKSCRLRWTNYLRPDIKRGRFSFEEEETIIQLHSVLGNKWSSIAARLPGRTDNEIKNYWNTHIRKRLLRNGIDPVTHAPRLDLLDLSSILTSAFCNPAILNLSNFLGTHQTLMNPDQILRLVNNITTLKQVNPEILLHYLQQNQLHNNNNFQAHQLFIQNQLVPTTQQQQQQQPNQILQNEQANGGEFSQNNFTNFHSNTIAQGNLNNIPNESNFEFDSSIPIFPGLSDYSVMSTPVSSPTQLNSSSTHNINSRSTTEDERDSYCSSLLKYEIPESLDINDFL
ncbi:hypothetical protein ACFE04_019323 [Oxalis oulophora]